MNRRDSLKSLGGVSLGSIVAFPVFSAAAAPVADDTAPMLRGTHDGRILESLDRGETWQPVASFGSHCSVHDVRRIGEQYYAKIGLQDHGFLLKSSDARTWLTVS